MLLFHRFRFLIAPTFRCLDAICVQEPEDVERWVALGVSRQRIHHVGSIKYDPTGVRLNPDLPLAGVRTVDEIRADSMAQTSFAMVMLLRVPHPLLNRMYAMRRLYRRAFGRLVCRNLTAAKRRGTLVTVHREDWARRRTNDTLRNAPHQQPRDRTPTVSAHDDQIDVVGVGIFIDRARHLRSPGRRRAHDHTIFTSNCRLELPLS